MNSSAEINEINKGGIWNGLKIKVIIDGETGEFVLYNSRFRLDIQGDKAFLMDYVGMDPIFTGYKRGNLWCFEEQEYAREDQDPFAAAIQVLYNILQYG
jgi:hypothetical protein